VEDEEEGVAEEGEEFDCDEGTVVVSWGCGSK
jgi:hypothetical protein